MVKFKLKQLIAEKEFKDDRRITYDTIAKKTGVSRTTLSKIASIKGYKSNTEIVEKLCKYFKCTPNDFIEIVG